MSLKPKRKRKTTMAQGKLRNVRVNLHKSDIDGVPMHSVEVIRGKKSQVIIEGEPDANAAFGVWETEMGEEQNTFRRGLRPFDPMKNDALLEKMLKEVYLKHRLATGYIPTKRLVQYLPARLGFKEAYADVTSRIILSLEYKGIIQTEYQMGLPMHGAGLGGNPEKRLVRINFRSDYE